MIANVVYRDGTAEDIGPAIGVFRESLMDLAVRFGVTVPPPQEADWKPKFEHVLRTGTFRVAEVDGQVVAHCMAVLRDGLWFLSSFWALPAFQGKKIGQPLLQQVMEMGRAQGAEVFSVWSTVDPNSVACYMKQGMLPGMPLMVMGGAPTALPELAGGYRVEDLQPETAHAIDQLVRGTAREVDHAFFAADSAGGGMARQVMLGDEAVGYFYVQGKAVGPAGWLREEHGEAVVAAALSECLQAQVEGTEPGEVRMVVPGCNNTAIRFALVSGLRVKNIPHFLTTVPFGKLENYVVSGPTLF